ncbi:uncharacterized protein LOC126816543 [Patella vulgata]|uniref:uncharacterized protein LOC126816543 n=1 Tax=Patella vulgata TaxID=6465 RepID=UPI00217F6423|nr:uncharacterized protein LOC126816543 [Patella vulgata]
MDGIEEIEGWLLDYACYHREFEVLKAISKRHPGCVDFHENLGLPTIRYASIIIHHIVDKSMFGSFSIACKLADDVYGSMKENLPFDTYAKLSCGLKIKSLFHYLTKRPTTHTLAKLNEYFPRTGLKNTTATSKELKKLNKLTSNFRKFFLPLLANENQRKDFIRNEYPEEYGAKYIESLKKIAYRFINLTEKQMPPPVIQKILDIGASNMPSSSPPVLAYEILLEYCMDKTTLSCQDLLDILTSISPLNTQDKVLTEHNFDISSSAEYYKFDKNSDGPGIVSPESPSSGARSTQPPTASDIEKLSNNLNQPEYTRLRNHDQVTNHSKDDNNISVIRDHAIINRSPDFITSIQTESQQRKNKIFPLSLKLTQPSKIFLSLRKNGKKNHRKLNRKIYRGLKRKKMASRRQVYPRSKKMRCSSQHRKSNTLRVRIVRTNGKMDNGCHLDIYSSSSSEDNDIIDRSNTHSSQVGLNLSHSSGNVTSLDLDGISSTKSNNIKSLMNRLVKTYCTSSSQISQELMESEAIAEGLLTKDTSIDDSDSSFEYWTSDMQVYSTASTTSERIHRHTDYDSVSDIDDITISADECEDNSEIIPSSCLSENVNSDGGSNNILTDLSHSITSHRKQEFCRKCIVKITRNKVLDVERYDAKYKMFS